MRLPKNRARMCPVCQKRKKVKRLGMCARCFRGLKGEGK